MPEKPVSWSPYFHLPERTVEYLSVGAFPGALSREPLDKNEKARRTLTQCSLTYPSSHPESNEDTAFIAGLLAKFLRRGVAPPPTLGIEKAALGEHGLIGEAKRLDEPRKGEPDPTEVGWKLNSTVSAESILRVAAERDEFALDPAFGFDPAQKGSDNSDKRLTEAEAAFLTTWLPTEAGKDAGHWLTPQAGFGALLGAAGDHRRVDFLLYHPFAKWPAVIEVDGPEHDTSDDAQRDKELKSGGFRVLRVKNEEVLRGEGSMLEKISNGYQDLRKRAQEHQITPEARFVVSCARATQVQFALVRALELGFLRPESQWMIELTGGDQATVAGIWDLLDLLQAFDEIYDLGTAPEVCVVKTEAARVARRWTGNHWEEITATPENIGTRFRLAVEHGASPFHKSERNEGFVLRPVFVPVDLKSKDSLSPLRIRHTELQEPPKRALRIFLQHGFRKFKFREGQAEAIHTVLRGRDCLVLLTTGAGKSLIYQLAGLLMPGWTLVVDPLVALIDDQLRGMRRYGLDRAAGIHRGTPEKDRDRIRRALGDGSCRFLLLAPERLQIGRFRSELHEFVQDSPVNLGVVDEAHCVSEWGHDFRPAYLNLGVNIRTHCKKSGDASPPLLGLTGTASRAVVRDTLVELGIDRGQSDAVIRPESFDRKELHYRMNRFKLKDRARDALPGILRGIPSFFQKPHAEFWRPKDKETSSGIIFLRVVNGPDGLYDVAKTVTRVTDQEPEKYAGSKPKRFKGSDDEWMNRKSKAADRFTGNEVSTLVSTKAFGMGIDKPNIRYIVVFGLPSSIEELYQIVGRAGRDEHPAHCLLISSERDQKETEKMLGNLDFDELRQQYDQWPDGRGFDDDLGSQLYFHLNSFQGKKDDLEDIEKILSDFGESWERRQVVSFAKSENKDKQKEKAIFRLRQVGVVEDYRKEWGSKRYEIDLSEPCQEDWDRSLRKYLQAAQPATSKPWLDRLDRIPEGSPRETALALAEVLVDYTYDQIEKSRRGMIREVSRLARQCKTDEEIRSRILSVLQEGDWAREGADLAEKSDIDWKEWWQFVLDKAQIGVEAGEMRGIFIRLLESSPSHPGLRLGRALVECWCSDRDEAVAANELKSALEFNEKVGASPENAVACLDEIVSFSAEDSERNAALAAPIAWGLHEFTEDDSSGVTPLKEAVARRLLGWLPVLASHEQIVHHIHEAALLERTWNTLERRGDLLRSWSADTHLNP